MGIQAAFMFPHPPLIIPEIGRGEEKKIQKTIDAYEQAAQRIGALCPETIVVISPHQVMYADYFHISPGNEAEGDFKQFRAEQVKIKAAYDTQMVGQLCKYADAKQLPAGTDGERDRRLDHGTMVPLYFVNKYCRDYKLVRIGLSGLPLRKHWEFGRCIQKAADACKKRTVIIASGDLSHRLKADGPYGYAKEGPAYDEQIMDIMARADFSKLLTFSEGFCEKAGECGHRSFTILAGALEGIQVKAEQLSYEGPFGVGYGICTYEVQEDSYVKLARQTIEEYVRTGRQLQAPQDLPKEMYSNRAGVFVSIKIKDNTRMQGGQTARLRGCIGTIRAVQPTVAQEIIHNAICAAAEDPRFDPVTPEELGQLTISVDVLGSMEKINSPDELDVKRYGVVVTNGYRRGLLLPNLEGVDTVPEQIAIAKQKAGIGVMESVQLERFEVVRHI